MSFLAPLFLLLGGAAAVPLLIHLLRRRIGIRVEFPAARYLARAEQEHSRTLKLRNLLLMLLRVVVLLLVAAAAARPIARWVGAGHAPTALAIVVDNSLSTTAVVNGRPLLAQIKALAKDVLARSTSSDRLWLVSADGRLRGGSAATLSDELDRMDALGGAGDLGLAVARAAEATRTAGLEARQVAVITDGQRTSWPTVAHLGDAQVLVWAPGVAPPPNRAVIQAEARPQRWTPRGAVVARVLSPDSASYRILLAGRVLARGTVAPNEEMSVHAAPPERGWVPGTVELEPDELPGDNVRAFAVWIGPPPGVTVGPAAGPFARSAIDVLKSSGQVVAGTDIGVVSADEVAALPALVFAPNDPVRAGVANRALERAGIPWRFGAVRRGESAVRGAQLDQVTATLRYELVPQGSGAADAETLAVVGREPWAVAGPRFVLVGSPMIPEATNLPVRAAFVPWLAAVLSEHLVGEPGQVIAAAPGSRIPRPHWAERLESPAGARTTLPASGPIDVPAVAGAYFFLRGDRRVGALVVNPEPEESRLERWPLANLAKHFEGSRVLTASDRASWDAQAFRAASRRSLVQPTLFLALLVLAIEAAMVAAGRRTIA